MSSYWGVNQSINQSIKIFICHKRKVQYKLSQNKTTLNLQTDRADIKQEMETYHEQKQK